MSEKIYLRVLRGGVYASFITLFFVFGNLLFPYITSKQIPFNLLVEFLAVVWVAFLVKFPAWRPFGRHRPLGRDWLTLGLLAFFAVLVVSSFTGVDFNLSFWGDVERMLGVFHLLHFLVLYLIIITVFRSWPEWRNLLMAAVAAAVVESFFALPQAASGQTAFGTLGNTSYVSGQMIFGIYFALILFFRQKNWVLRSAYVLGIIVMFVAFKNAGTRGAYIGLAASILLFLFLLAVYNKNLKIRYGSIAAAALLVLGIGLIMASPDSGWVKDNRLFSRIAQINAQANTFQTRLISWKSGFKDLPNHFLLGTGYGNFAVSFDKYFDPKFYDYSRGETYFDHAHNNLVDILSTTGLLGLLSYLSIFAAIVYYLVRLFRRKQLGLVEFGLLGGLLAAYFIQNIVLFDSFVTYLYLMILFGFIFWLVRQAPDETEPAAVSSGKPATVDNRGAVVVSLALALALFVAYQYNWRPYQMLKLTIEAQIAANHQNDLPQAMAKYQEAFALETVLDRDSRNTLSQLLLQRIDLLNQLEPDKAREYLKYAVEQQEKNVALNPKDSFAQLMLAQILNLTASFYGDNPEKFSHYSKRAAEAMEATIQATPGRATVYFTKAQILLTLGKKEEAIETMLYAVSLNPKFPDSTCQLAKVYGYAGKAKEAEAATDRCVDLGGVDMIYSGQQLVDLTNRYVKAKQLDRAAKTLRQLTAVAPKNVQAWTSLADIERQLGRKQEAIAAARRAAELDPALKASAEEFIRSLEQSE